MKEITKDRIYFVVFLGAFVLFLCSCGNNKNTNSTMNNHLTVKELINAKKQDPDLVCSSCEFDGNILTLSGVKDYNYYEGGFENKYIIFGTKGFYTYISGIISEYEDHKDVAVWDSEKVFATGKSPNSLFGTIKVQVYKVSKDGNTKKIYNRKIEKVKMIFRGHYLYWDKYDGTGSSDDIMYILDGKNMGRGNKGIKKIKKKIDQMPPDAYLQLIYNYSDNPDKDYPPGVEEIETYAENKISGLKYLEDLEAPEVDPSPIENN